MSRKRLNIVDTISELKQIIEKYGGIPSQQIDKAAYGKINYVIRHYGDVPDVKSFLTEYSDLLKSNNPSKRGKSIDLVSTVEELKRIIEKYKGIPSPQVDKSAYAKIYYVLNHYGETPEVKFFLNEYSDLFKDERVFKRERKIDLVSKVEEFKKILEKYGKIPSQYEDRKAYTSITYCLKNYADTPEIQEFVSQYGDLISSGSRLDFSTRLKNITESLKKEERIPAVKENQELYVAVRYLFDKNPDNPDVTRLRYIYAHHSCFPLSNTKYGPKPESKKICVINHNGNEYFTDDNPELPKWRKNVAYEFIEYVFNTYNELPAKKTKPMQLLLKQISHWERYGNDCAKDISEPLHKFLRIMIDLGCQDEIIIKTFNSFEFGDKKVLNNVRNLLIENGTCAIKYIAQCANPGKPVTDRFAYYYFYNLFNETPKSREKLPALGELYSYPAANAVIRVHYRDYQYCNLTKIRQQVVSCPRDWEENPPETIEEFRQFGCFMFFSAEGRSKWNEKDPLFNKTYIQSSFENGQPYFRFYKSWYNHKYLDYYLFLLENGYRLQDNELLQQLNPITLCNSRELSDFDYEIVYKILCLHEDCIVDEHGTIYYKTECGYSLLMFAPGTINYTVKSKTYKISRNACALCRQSIENITFKEELTEVNENFSSCASLQKIIIPQTKYKEYLNLFSKRDVTFFHNYNHAKIPLQALFEGTKLISVPYVDEYHVPEGTTEIDKDAFNGTAVKYVIITGSVKNVHESLFWCHHSIEQVVFKEGIESINASVFGHCENLRSVYFPNSLKEIRGALFSGCKQLKYIHLKENIEYIGYGTFRDSYIEELKIDGYIKRISDNAFDSYPGAAMRKIEFNGGIGWIESKFNCCKNLEEIHFMGEYERFSEEGMNMFEYCEKLKCIKIRRKYYDFFIGQIHESKRNLVMLVD